jgi:hypothetical protein
MRSDKQFTPGRSLALTKVTLFAADEWQGGLVNEHGNKNDFGRDGD